MAIQILIALRIPPIPTPPRPCPAPLGPPERTYKVVFAGDAAVGKSTFITRLCKGVFVSNTASTLGRWH